MRTVVFQNTKLPNEPIFTSSIALQPQRFIIAAYQTETKNEPILSARQRRFTDG
jgi:hypothetical protein